MKQRVEKPTRERYKISNITFILWMFDQHNKYPSLLQPTLYFIMQTKNLEDISQMVKGGKWYKSRYEIRAVCLESLQKIKPYVQASIPVKLEHLKFTIFSRVLSTVKKKEKGVYKSKEQVTTWLLK